MDLLNQFGIDGAEAAKFIRLAGLSDDATVQSIVSVLPAYEYYNFYNRYFQDVSGTQFATVEAADKDQSVLYTVATLAKNNFDDAGCIWMLTKQHL